MLKEIAFVGFGEAAQAFAAGFAAQGLAGRLRAFDIATEGPRAGQKHEELRRQGVSPAACAADLCAGADVIFSLVTADQAENAARAAAQVPLSQALYLDCNSCAPETKRRAAAAVEAAGGRYVDVAIMTPVHPKGHRAPCFLAGPHARSAHDAMGALGMVRQIVAAEVGGASMRKMIRSVMIKGLEALTLECFLAARKAGIEDEIRASLDQSFPGFDWSVRAPYMMERAATHGLRRAAEMEEVAQTLRDLGLPSDMTQGTVTRQRAAGALGLDLRGNDIGDLAGISDLLLRALAGQADARDLGTGSPDDQLPVCAPGQQ